jgi:hypothetical protein
MTDEDRIRKAKENKKKDGGLFGTLGKLFEQIAPDQQE